MSILLQQLFYKPSLSCLFNVRFPQAVCPSGFDIAFSAPELYEFTCTGVLEGEANNGVFNCEEENCPVCLGKIITVSLYKSFCLSRQASTKLLMSQLMRTQLSRKKIRFKSCRNILTIV